MKRLLRKAVKGSTTMAFSTLDRVGIHVLPKHYYTPVADYEWLRNNRELWMRRASMAGVCWDLDAQLEWLAKVSTPFYHEVKGLETYHGVSNAGPGFGPIESQVLHCFIRAKCPSHIVEIGSGVSTACMLNAIDLNEREGKPRSTVTCIEPFPVPELDQLVQTGAINHIAAPCQAVPNELFSKLTDGDLLFIDSTHAVKAGSDVVRICLDILPSLPSGIFVHIHDVYLPYLYGRDKLSSYFDWQETTLVLALLTNNPKLEVLTCLSALHYDRSGTLKTILTDYVPQPNDEGLQASSDAVGHFPSSLWLRTRL